MNFDIYNPKEYYALTDVRIIDRIKSMLPPSLRKHGPKFLLYLMNSPKHMSMLLKDSFYSCVLPSRFIQSHFDALYKMKDIGIDQLLSLGVIYRSHYKRPMKNVAGLCREYNINPELALDLMLYANENGLTLFTAKNPVTKQRDDDRPVVLSPNSPLYSAMSHAFKNVVSVRSIEDYCVARYQSIRLKKDKLMKRNPRRFYSELKSIFSDWQKYTTLLLRGFKNDTTNEFNYRKNFLLTSTGRLCEIDGGLQGLSRGCKAFIYKDIPDINNYDIRGCHLALLSYYGKKIGIDTTWIDEYIKDDSGKKAYARRVGISINAWKTTVLSLVYGSSDTKWGTPYQTILKDKGGNRKQALQCFNVWKEQTDGLRSICKLWLSKIKKYTRSIANKNILENAVGVQINLKEKSATKKYLSSFLLQGMESRILAELINYKTKEYQVVSPEYDGLVVVGKISDRVWHTILTKIGIANSNLILENKPFN